MPLFRFHVRSLLGLERDDTGLDLPDLETAYLEAWLTIPEIAADLVREGRNPMLHAFEITDATGQKLIEVPFSERLKDGRPLQRPRRPKEPRSKAMPGERRPKAGAVYYLQCSYRFVDDRQGLAVETRGVKARDADAAIAAAQKICLDPSHMQLTSAFLFSPEGTIVWSKRVLREPIRWANATRGVPRFAQI